MCFFLIDLNVYCNGGDKINLLEILFNAYVRVCIHSSESSKEKNNLINLA